jgi:predicted glycosyltransferase
MNEKIWVDIVNPSHSLFFRPLVSELKNNYDIFITFRDRAETTDLAEQFGLKGQVIGREYENLVMKTIIPIFRTFILGFFLDEFKYSICFENSSCIAFSKIKKKKSILFLDNDLKYKLKLGLIQNFESKIKLMANYVIVPEVCKDIFTRHVGQEKLITYRGFKEDFYIADYSPDVNFKKLLPFDSYVVIRPESFTSLYVKKENSIVPDLVKKLNKENINVVYLPRDKSDSKFIEELNVFSPNRALNGLDLVYFSDATLTGSGTMAREAACLGRPSVSFFPGDELLSVDQQLISENKMYHSRDTEKIVEYVLSKKTENKISCDLKRSINVKKEVLEIIYRIIRENG